MVFYNPFQTLSEDYIRGYREGRKEAFKTAEENYKKQIKYALKNLIEGVKGSDFDCFTTTEEFNIQFKKKG